MNKDLFDQYKKLQDSERLELNYKFKASPKALLFLDFLQKCTQRNFKTAEVVSLLYPEDKSTAYPVLENRYFKLRKKLLDELQALSKDDSQQLLTDEERVLFQVKNITFQENKEAAYRQLNELEKKCWELNIFELLPTVIDQLIFYNQIFNRHAENKVLFERMERANRLLFEINKVILTARKIYELNFYVGIKGARKELALLKELAVKNKDYPRFLLCYHHISLYYKLGSSDYLSEMQVISRHLAEFKRLYAKHATMPLVSYKVNYERYQHFHFNQSTLFFYFNRCEFVDAAVACKTMWDMVNEPNSIFRTYKTESFYNNCFTVFLMAGRFEEANAINDAFIAFLKENGQQEKLSHAYSQKARLYVDTFPDSRLVKFDPDFLLTQLNEYIKKLKKEENTLVSLDQVQTLKMELLIGMKSYKNAELILKDPIVKVYLSGHHCWEHYRELLDNLLETGKLTESGGRQLIKKIEKQLFQSKIPGEVLHLRWLIRYIKYAIK